MRGTDRDDHLIEELSAALGDIPFPRTPDGSAGRASSGDAAAVTLVEALRRRRERTAPSPTGALSGLAGAVHRLRVLGHPHETLRHACTEASEITGFERIAISALGPDGTVGVLHSVGDHGAGPPGAAAVPSPGSPEATAIRTGTSVLDDVAAADGAAAYGDGPRAVVPLLRAGTVIGLFHAAHDPARRVEVHEVASLEAFAAVFTLVWRTGALEARWHESAAGLSDAIAVALESAPVEPGAELDLPGHPDPLTATLGEAHDRPEDDARADVRALTSRERVVLDHLLVGATNREIAEALVVSVDTVKTHVKHILRKFGAVNRAELISRTYRG